MSDEAGTIPQAVSEFLGNFSAYQKEGMTHQEAALAMFADISPIVFKRSFDVLTMHDVNAALDEQRKLYEWAIEVRGNKTKGAYVRDGKGWGMSIAKAGDVSSLIIQFYPLSFAFSVYLIPATVVKPVNLNFGVDVAWYCTGKTNLVLNLGFFAVSAGWRWKERYL